MSYKFVLSNVRSSVKEGTRYARVRAIANGTDSYNTIFTTKARSKLIEQLKSNNVKTNALHSKAITDNIQAYLKDRASKTFGEEKVVIDNLLGHIPNTEFPIGIVEDAYFADDNTIEAIIRENKDLANMGEEQARYLDGAWNMIESGALGGVSVVFNNVKTFMNKGTEFIDDLSLQGLDFVDRASHDNTRVVETFMRAMQDASAIEETKMTNEEENKQVETPVKEVPKTEDPGMVDVDKIVEQAVAKVEEKKAKAEADSKLSEQEKALQDKDSLLKEQEAKLKAIEAEKNEAIELAEKAAKIAEDAVVKIDNPFAEQAAKSNAPDPLDGKSVRELFKIKQSIN